MTTGIGPWFRTSMFEKRCPACKGKGELRAELPDDTWVIRRCRRCEGAGTEPTALGHQLLGFLRRHQTLRIRDAAVGVDPRDAHHVPPVRINAELEP